MITEQKIDQIKGELMASLGECQSSGDLAGFVEKITLLMASVSTIQAGAVRTCMEISLIERGLDTFLKEEGEASHDEPR